MHSYVYYFSVGSMTGRNGKGINVYFVANFTEELISFGTWNDGHLDLGSVYTAGKECGAFAGEVFLLIIAFLSIPIFYRV